LHSAPIVDNRHDTVLFLNFKKVSPMPSIIVAGLAWSRPDGQNLFSDLDLTFGMERVGLVGRNGVGKTTLLKIMSGQMRPSRGSVSVDGSLAMARQAVQIGVAETVADLFGVTAALSVLRRAAIGEATVDELAEADWTVEERTVAALSKLGLDARPETALTRLSGGQRTRAALAAAIFRRPDFLLLDEPTNNLDGAGMKAVTDLVADWRSGAIVVSHDRRLLDHMDAIVEMTSLAARRYGGNWSVYQAIKATELEASERDLAQAEKSVADVNRKAQLLAERKDRRDAAGARKGNRGDMPRILLGMRKNKAEASKGQGVKIAERRREEALDAAEAARSRVETLRQLSVVLPPTGLAAGRTVLALDGVSAGYEVGHPIIRELSFSIVGPERTAIGGPNGSGKTTLLKLIAGELSPTDGTVSVNVPFAMLDQSVGILDPDATILDNFMRLNPQSKENACRATLATFLFRADSALQRVGMLSGGQMLRAGLACVLGGTHPPALLILDEPTNHLDIASIEAIEAGLLAYDGALLVVSHDETFLTNIGVVRKVEMSKAAPADRPPPGQL
jgi:ATPase subunit of ABC transporter with duplicated ATPase domains